MRKLMQIIDRWRYRNEPLRIDPWKFDKLAAGASQRLVELGLLKDEPKANATAAGL